METVRRILLSPEYQTILFYKRNNATQYAILLCVCVHGREHVITRKSEQRVPPLKFAGFPNQSPQLTMDRLMQHLLTY